MIRQYSELIYHLGPILQFSGARKECIPWNSYQHSLARLHIDIFPYESSLNFCMCSIVQTMSLISPLCHYNMFMWRRIIERTRCQSRLNTQVFREYHNLFSLVFKIVVDTWYSYEKDSKVNQRLFRCSGYNLTQFSSEDREDRNSGVNKNEEHSNSTSSTFPVGA